MSRELYNLQRYGGLWWSNTFLRLFILSFPSICMYHTNAHVCFVLHWPYVLTSVSCTVSWLIHFKAVTTLLCWRSLAHTHTQTHTQTHTHTHKHFFGGGRKHAPMKADMVRTWEICGLKIKARPLERWYSTALLLIILISVGAPKKFLYHYVLSL